LSTSSVSLGPGVLTVLYIPAFMVVHVD